MEPATSGFCCWRISLGRLCSQWSSLLKYGWLLDRMTLSCSRSVVVEVGEQLSAWQMRNRCHCSISVRIGVASLVHRQITSRSPVSLSGRAELHSLSSICSSLWSSFSAQATWALGCQHLLLAQAYICGWLYQRSCHDLRRWFLQSKAFLHIFLAASCPDSNRMRTLSSAAFWPHWQRSICRRWIYFIWCTDLQSLAAHPADSYPADSLKSAYSSAIPRAHSDSPQPLAVCVWRSPRSQSSSLPSTEQLRPMMSVTTLGTHLLLSA